jgi:hypothetical protein
VTSAAAPATARDRPAIGPLGDVLRDIARGGLAGVVVGIVVAGLGGRAVMRLAAVFVPDSAGSLTQNGNRIGEITLSGSLGLILFAGLFFGVFGGTVWVVVSPWIPGTGLRRAILTMPIAVALTGIALIQGTNPDFGVLRNDGRVVAMLLALVALAGLMIAILDGWLDRRLPGARASGGADALYVIVTLMGGLLVFPLVLVSYLGQETRVGFALVGVGLVTLAWWALRLRGQAGQSSGLLITGRVALAVAIAFGLLDLAPEVADALGTT